MFEKRTAGNGLSRDMTFCDLERQAQVVEWYYFTLVLIFMFVFVWSAWFNETLS